jgi:hypothetical protein
MEGFNHQNAIFGLAIEQKTREEGPTPYFKVDFDPSLGIDASFTCQRIEITEAVPCTAGAVPQRKDLQSTVTRSEVLG